MPQHGQRKIREETGRIKNGGTNPLQTGIGHVIGIRIIVGVAFIIGHFARRHGELSTPVVRTLFSHTVGQHVAAKYIEAVLFVPITPPQVKCTIDRRNQEIGLQMCHIIQPMLDIDIHTVSVKIEDTVILRIPKSTVTLLMGKQTVHVMIVTVHGFPAITIMGIHILYQKTGGT